MYNNKDHAVLDCIVSAIQVIYTNFTLKQLQWNTQSVMNRLVDEYKNHIIPL